MLQQIRAISSKGSDPFDDKEWEKIKKKIKWQQGLGQELEQGQVAPNTTLPSGFDQHIQAGWFKKAVKQSSIQIHEFPVKITVDPVIIDSRPVIVEKGSGDIHIGPKDGFHDSLLKWLGLNRSDISVDGRINYGHDNMAYVEMWEKNSDYGSTVIKWMQAEEPDITFAPVKGWAFSSVKQSSIQIHRYPKSDTSFDPQAWDSRPVVVEKESGDIHIGPKNSFHQALLTWLALSWTDISVDGRIHYHDDDTADVAIEENHQDYGEFVTKWMQAEEPYITFKSIGKGNWTFSAVDPKRINDNKDPFDPVAPEELKPWQPGEYGKFIGTPDQTHIWSNQANPYHDNEDVVFDGWPAHQAVADALGLGQMYTKNWDSNYAAGWISPDGGLSVVDNLHDTVDKMIQQDPRLHEDVGWTFSKVVQIVPQWAGDPEDMDPDQKQVHPILYAFEKLYVGHGGLHHMDIIEWLNIPRKDFNDAYFGLINLNTEFDSNSISWFEPLKEPPNWQEAEQALSQFFNAKLWTDLKQEWRFGNIDLDEFDPLSDDDYMGEDFDDQAIKDLLQKGVRGGHSGKGLKLPDGSFVYWEADVHGAPHHMEVLQTLGVRDSRQVEFLMVSREGDIKNEAVFDNQAWQFE